MKFFEVLVGHVSGSRFGAGGRWTLSAWLVAVAFTVVDIGQRRRMGLRTPDGVDIGSSLFATVVYRCTSFAMSFIVFGPLFDFVSRNWQPVHLRGVGASVAVLFVVTDFTGYVVHRGEHRLNVLWRGHRIHHSGRGFGMDLALRMPWTEAVYRPIVFLWMPAVGLSAKVVTGWAMFTIVVGFVQHSAVFGPSRLDRVLMTPWNHSVHHARNPCYLNRNFGTWTVVWDRLFGTYVARVEFPDFGESEVLSFGAALDEALRGGYRLASERASAALHR